MFGEDIFSSFFQTPFFGSQASLTNARGFCGRASDIPSNCLRPPQRVERCSQNPRDWFTEISRAVDQAFAETARSFFHDAEMFSRHFQPSYLRQLSQIPRNHEGNTGVTLNGEVVERPNGSTRFGRHNNNSIVQLDRNRLQWYDSNTRRSLAPPPPPSNRSEPCGRLTMAELSKLPISTFRIQPGKLSGDTSSPEQSQAGSSTPVCVKNRNDSQTNFTPGSAYLQPASRFPTIVEIQPLQSSPARGYPECEVCLSEYRDKDRLRHLPCGHAFHSKCIDVWFAQSSTCPKCRAGVRTGLKRLERNRQRNASVSRPPPAAPIRAIRQRASGSFAEGNRRTSAVNLTTSQTPIQQVRRNQSTASNARQRSIYQTPHHSMSPTTSLGAREAPNAKTNSQHAPGADNPERGNDRSALNPVGVEGGDTSREMNESPEASSSNTTGPTSSRTGTPQTRQVISGAMDKSAYARRKAAEAAIRRAELERQQQQQL
ncbi:E3 ubiquitin-protein ligase RNF12-B [Fasciolopsis buskii]|uniref:E3 ubiquitin-protein ligase RNF12-B n=1 Tax=Fasciolopsis buskii TaxID=27845 RepID=A0A8E0S2T8_9TREM|nr:E3 ubiquitin-protein ligase RNF12-B [Fasciolopsis buski]